MEGLEARLARANGDIARLRAAIGQRLLGQAEVVDQVLWGLITGGHVLLEGNPGLGKTLLVRTLAESLELRFSRIQFTPDLMPSDITGTNVLSLDAAGRPSGQFALHRGPIFGNVVLADEINRATPKTQSALLEAMQEHAVTIAGTRHALDEPFFVLATENPIEMEGTYPLPEAQLDRFLLKIQVPSPGVALLTDILRATTGEAPKAVEPVLGASDVLALRALCREIAAAEPVLDYAARLVTATSPETSDASTLVRRSVRFGAGVRGAQALVLAAKAVALLEGRGHVAFADVKRTLLPVLRHRVIRSFEGEAEGISTDRILDEVGESVPMRPANVERALEEA